MTDTPEDTLNTVRLTIWVTEDMAEWLYTRKESGIAMSFIGREALRDYARKVDGTEFERRPVRRGRPKGSKSKKGHGNASNTA